MSPQQAVCARTNTVNIAILGFAHPHVHSYIDAWRRHPEMGIRVTAGWDRDPARLAEAANKHAIPTLASPEDICRDQNLQAVLIAAETSLHAELVECAAAAGKAIVLQKPLALTLSEADRIVRAVEDAAVPFTIAWQMRVDPENIKMKELVDSGCLGRIFMVRRRHGLPTHLWPGFDNSWHVNPEYNRDIWADDAAHPFDFVYWLMGMPVTVYAEIGSLLNPRIPNDNGIAIFRYEDGRFVEVSCSFTCIAGENTTEIIGEKGVVIQNYGDAPSSGVPRPPGAISLKWYLQETGQWTISSIPGPPNQGHRIAALAAPLAEFLHGRRPPIASAREGRDTLRMILASYESNETGARVRL
jgi:predicted dehydrogenase